MTDIWPVAELDQPTSRSRQAMPALAVVTVLLLVAAIAAVLLGLGDDDRTPAERLAAAPAAVEDARTFAFELTIGTSVGDTDVSSAITGSVDAAAGRSSAKVAVAAIALELVSDGDVLYVRVPETARAGNAGRAWVKVDASTLGQGFGITGGANSPLDSIRALAGSSEVEEVGEEEVRGTKTTHFRTTVDLSKSLGVDAQAALPPEQRALFEQLTKVPVDVWLDDDDRVRRQRTTIDLAFPGLPNGASTKVVTTLEAFDYGKDVDIEIPSADEVNESPAAPGLGGLFGGTNPSD